VPCRVGRRFPGAAFAAALQRTGARLAFVGVPDNPTGVAPTARWLENVTARFPQTVFVVDEAYHEFFGRTCIPLVRHRPNVLVARTLSKAYGLAGARVGALIGPARLIDRLHRINMPYPVTGPAAAIALAALADQDHVRASVRAARRATRRMTRELRALRFTVTAPRTNFVLVHLRDARAARTLAAHLLRAGIAVRDRSHLPGMAGIVRISSGTEQETDRFLAAMHAYRARHPARRNR
jgi:histidinol-phosphate aminotransferase